MNKIGIMSGLAAAAIWGGMYVVSKVVLEVIPPFTLITLRLLLGILTLAILVAIQGGLGFRPEDWLHVLGVGLVGYGVSLGFQFIGTKLSNASNGALITSATPAFVLFFAFWIMKEPLTWRRIVALGIASMGVLVVINPANAKLSPEFFLGNLSLVAAAATWALYSVLIRKVTRRLRPLPVSLVAFIGGLFITIPAGYWEWQTIGIGAITMGVVWGVLYLGIVSTALAMFLWNYAFAKLDAGLASLTFFAQPVVGAGLGAWLLGEKLTPLFYVGGGLIGLGIWIAIQENP